MKTRCGWAGTDPLYLAYHDAEWGVPVHDDRKLFEMLLLEGAQAGLSWITILRKREHYRKAFSQFDAGRISRYDARAKKQLMANPGIVRNKLKIAAAIENARAFLQTQRDYGSFDEYIWQFVEGVPKQNAWNSLKEIPPKTVESESMSKDLRARGFRFVGPTICYAFMQATGMVNDHVATCFRYKAVKRIR